MMRSTQPKRTTQVGEPVQIADGRWVVFSAGSDEVYEVRLLAWGWDCSCADYAYRHMCQGGLCKHAAACWAQALDAEVAGVVDAQEVAMVG
jgi:hypothetical protein